MAAELDKDTVAKAYARWAPIYDLVFGAVFDRGRKASIAAAERTGGHILEVGVGTGLSLPEYSRTNRLIGVDLSAPMLRKAKVRAAEHHLTNVEGLAVMDAQHLGFRDGVFDVVVAQYVITTVPDPEATLDEFARVVSRAARSFSLIILARRTAYGRRSNKGSRRSRAGSAGGRNSAGSAWRNGPRGTAACVLSNGAPMPPLGQFSLIRFARLGNRASEPFAVAAGAAQA